MSRYIVVLLGLYGLSWVLMLGVGVAHSVWGIGTISWQDSIGLTVCFVVGILTTMLAVGGIVSGSKKD